jgi:hypothetical protein
VDDCVALLSTVLSADAIDVSTAALSKYLPATALVCLITNAYAKPTFYSLVA